MIVPSYKYGIDRITNFIVDYSGILSMFLVFCALSLLLITLIFPVGYSSSAVEIYSRNFSTFISLLIMSSFFSRYRKVYFSDANREYMRLSKIALRNTTKLLVIACIIKVILSAYYSVQYLVINGNLIGLYYLIEVAVWGAVGLFAYAYMMKHTLTRSSSSKKTTNQ